MTLRLPSDGTCFECGEPPCRWWGRRARPPVAYSFCARHGPHKFVQDLVGPMSDSDVLVWEVLSS